MTEATIHTWTAEPLSADVHRALRRLARVDGVVQIAVMPDVHLASEVCVGVAVATRDVLLPAAVGGDIGCGMAAIRFDCEADRIADETTALAVLDAIREAVPIARHHRTRAPPLPSALSQVSLSHHALDKKKHAQARLQLGTLGRGNHFVEFQSDEEGALWLMVHSGSRGLGQAIRDHHADPRSKLTALEAESEAGRAYLHDLHWALAFAEHNRGAIVRAVSERVRGLLGASVDDASMIACHHNFVRREQHACGSCWVHRKGAISADTDELGIIPGSMGTLSHHVRGRGCENALRTSSHGAGRALSRSAARRRIRGDDLLRSMQNTWFDHRLAARLVEEAPAAYKDIAKVMRAQRELTKIERRLLPVLVFKGT